MKNTYLFLIGLLFLFTLSCDRGEEPSYKELILEKNEVIFDFGDQDEIELKEATVNIVEGNENYRLKPLSENDVSVALAKIVGNKIHITTNKEFGEANYLIYDWTNSSKTLTIKVRKNERLVLFKDKITIKEGENIIVDIYSGNGDYKLTSSKPEVAKVELHDRSIAISAIKEGITEITVSDKLDQKATLTVEVDSRLEPLYLSNPEDSDLDILNTDTPVNVPFGGGNGGFVVSRTSYVTATINEETKEIQIVPKSISRGIDKLTVTDRYGQVLNFNIVVDHPFLTNSTPRLRIENTFPLVSTSQFSGHVKVSYDPVFKSSRLEAGTTSIAYGIQYQGDLSEGLKQNARIYQSAKGIEANGTSIGLSKCELVKVDEGVYWVIFTQEDGIDGYMVVKE